MNRNFILFRESDLSDIFNIFVNDICFSFIIDIVINLYYLYML